MFDSSERYANEYNFWIYFQHIASGLEASFKGFLTGFEDSYSSEWNDTQVYGRMDPISTFRGTRRQINFSFDVVAYGEEEARLNFARSRRLIQMLYPVYEDLVPGDPQKQFSATSIQAPPLLRVRFANLISGGQPGDNIEAGLVGKLGGLSYNPDFEHGVFTNPSNGGQILPKVNRFVCNYTVFHTEPLGWNQDALVRTDHERFPYSKTTTEYDENLTAEAEIGGFTEAIASVSEAISNHAVTQILT